MEGYSVVTTDERTVGHVVGVRADYYIVESGLVLKKARYPLPKRLASVEPARERLLIQMSKETLHGAPKVGPGGTFDEQAVAAYYGE
jgi:hypothetical protein